jgi:CheY-like chemotaxis protein
MTTAGNEANMESSNFLVVDADPASLGLMSEVLGPLKSSVCPVSDGLKAATLVNQERFDGIFLDIELADLDGLKLPELVRQSSMNKCTPIIVLTGQDKCDTMYKSFAMGVTFVLPKPIDRLKLARLYGTLQSPWRENRRQYNRVPLQTEVVCTVGPRQVTGTAWNLSQGGVQLEVAGLSCGETVQLSIRLPEPPIGIEAMGVVAWANDDRQGVHFTRMSVEHQEMVRDFIIRSGLSPK